MKVEVFWASWLLVSGPSEVAQPPLVVLSRVLYTLVDEQYMVKDLREIFKDVCFVFVSWILLCQTREESILQSLVLLGMGRNLKPKPQLATFIKLLLEECLG